MRINGILTQLAAATAAKGTKRPTRGGIDLNKIKHQGNDNLILMFFVSRLPL